MKRDTAKRSSLFLLELIIAILFFSLCSAVCIQLFAKAHIKSNAAADLNMALTKAQSVAETFRTTDDIGDSHTVYYDKSWKTCQQSLAVYEMQVDVQASSQMASETIRVISVETSEEIYKLSVNKHIANRRADYEP